MCNLEVYTFHQYFILMSRVVYCYKKDQNTGEHSNNLKVDKLLCLLSR